jgi:hypothetical protein
MTAKIIKSAHRFHREEVRPSEYYENYRKELQRWCEEHELELARMRGEPFVVQSLDDLERLRMAYINGVRK